MPPAPARLLRLASLLGLLLAGGCAEEFAPPHRLLIVGVDGATFDVMDPLIAAGELPTFAKLRAEGASAVLRSERPMRSPALWTTIATGRPRSVHGIYDFVTGSRYWPPERRRVPRRLVTTDARAVRALWNYATEAGLASLVVGWLNTWPAERLEGVMIAPYVALGEKRQISIKGKIYAGDPRQAHPPDALEPLAAKIVAAEDVSKADVGRIVEVPAADSTLFEQIPGLARMLFAVRWSLASTRSNTDILVDLLGRHPDARLAVTYFDGADTLGHRFWATRQPLPRIRARLSGHGIDPALAEELARRFGRAVDGYYQVLDDALARLIAAAGPETNVLVVSDHGWGDMDRDHSGSERVPFNGIHTLDGVLLAWGPDVAPGRFEALSLYEVAPTALYLMGLEVPEELDGRVAMELIRPELLAARPPRVRAASAVPEDWRPAFAAPIEGDAPFADTEIERLQSLGYVD